MQICYQSESLQIHIFLLSELQSVASSEQKRHMPEFEENINSEKNYSYLPNNNQQRTINCVFMYLYVTVINLRLYSYERNRNIININNIIYFLWKSDHWNSCQFTYLNFTTLYGIGDFFLKNYSIYYNYIIIAIIEQQ